MKRAASWPVWIALVLGGLALWRLQMRPEKSNLLLAATLGAVGLTLLLSEWRAKGFTALVERLGERPRLAYAFVGILGLILARSELTPGHLFYGDGMPHSGLSWLVWKALSEGEIPYWTNYWYSGFPMLEYYPPLFHLLAGAANLALHDIHASQKLVNAAAVVGSALSMFALLRALLGKDEVAAAVLGAVAYAASPWHFFHVLHLNRFPIGLVWALLPLPYYFFERRGPRPAADAVLCAMSLALIVIAHTGYFLFATVLFTLYALLRSLLFSASSREVVRDLLFLAGAGAATAALGAGFALPLLVEKDLVFDMPDLARGRFFFDQPTLASVLSWSRFPAGHSGYLGISIVLLGLLGAGRTLLSKPLRRLAPWTALLAIAAFLALGHGLPGYGRIPFVYSMFYAGRYLELVAFALAVLAAVGFAPAARGLERALGFLKAGPGRARALGVLLGLVLLDVGMAGFFRHPRPLWEGEKRIVYDVLARAASDRRPRDGFFRALDLTSPTSIFNEELAGNTVLPVLTGAASPYGDVPWCSPRSFPFLTEAILEVQAEYRETGGFSPEGRDLLRAMGVAFVVGGERVPETGGEPWPAPVVKRDALLAVVPGATPLLAAGRLEAAPPELLPAPDAHWWTFYPGGEWPSPWASERPAGALVRRMALAPEAPEAERFFVRDLSGLPDAVIGEGPRGLHVSRSALTSTRVEVEFTLEEDAWLRLPLSHHPDLQLALDGAPAAALASASGFTLLRAPAGRHTLTARAGVSPLRAGATWASAAAWAAALAFLAQGAAARRGKAAESREEDPDPLH